MQIAPWNPWTTTMTDPSEPPHAEPDHESETLLQGGIELGSTRPGRQRGVIRNPVDEAPSPGRRVPIFDRAALRRQLRLAGIGAGDLDAGVESGNQPSDETVRLNRLRSLRWEDDCRPLLTGQPAMHQALARLRGECPAFVAVIDLVERAVCLSEMAGTGIAIPAVLLVGPPGLGKTHFARRLAGAIGAEQHAYSCATNSDAQALLVGHPPSWRGARMGVITEALLASSIANPVLVLDELDKLVTHATEKPYNTLLTLLEPENAVALVDEFLRIPFDLSHCLIVATANDLDALPDYIRDRFLIVAIEPPSRETLRAIARNIASAVIAAHGQAFAMPSDVVIAQLAQANPRTIRRVVTLALGFAAAAKRVHLAIADVDAAMALTAGAIDRQPIGFVSSRQG
jgi:ATP-dependent Lon protease